MYLMSDAALAMIGSWGNTGMVVSVGDSSTSAVAIYEGTNRLKKIGKNDLCCPVLWQGNTTEQRGTGEIV